MLFNKLWVGTSCLLALNFANSELWEPVILF